MDKEDIPLLCNQVIVNKFQRKQVFQTKQTFYQNKYRNDAKCSYYY